jgi:hypothetical protein
MFSFRRMAFEESGVKTRAAILAISLAVAASACDREGGSERTASAAPDTAIAAAAKDAERPVRAPAPAKSYVLSGNGLLPGLTFGTAQSDAIAAATAAFGKASPLEHNDECGEGPMDFVSFGDLQLGFQEGKLAGWSMDGSKPALRTAGGLAVGAPRSALGNVALVDSSLGQEFYLGAVGGILSEDGETIAALWAGYPCQFR